MKCRNTSFLSTQERERGREKLKEKGCRKTENWEPGKVCETTDVGERDRRKGENERVKEKATTEGLCVCVCSCERKRPEKKERKKRESHKQSWSCLYKGSNLYAYFNLLVYITHILLFLTMSLDFNRLEQGKPNLLLPWTKTEEIYVNAAHTELGWVLFTVSSMLFLCIDLLPLEVS